MNKNSAKEERILQVAEELFLAKGYSGTSTTEIAKKAGCNQALVHYYFRTKENLFQQIFFQKIATLLAEIMQEAPSETDFVDKLRVRIGLYFDFMNNNRHLPFMVINELVTNPERRQAFCATLQEHPINKQFYRQIDEEIRREIQAGRICPIETAQLYLSILSLTVAAFLTLPVYSELCQFDPEAERQYLRKRKQEVIDTIVKRLQP